MPYRICLISLGCAKNQVNSEQMLYLLNQAGHEGVGEVDGCDVAIVNTCGFIDSAKSEAIDNILAMAQLKAEGRIQKILVTGKGRCNVTNDCTAEEFLHHVRTNPRFLFSSLGAFPPARTMELFESLGVELKVERGRRVFPVSDKAEEIRQALLRYAQDAELVHDGARKLLLEELPPEAEEAPAVPENPRHPKKKKAGPALRCIGVRGTSGREYRADAVLVETCLFVVNQAYVAEVRAVTAATAVRI